MLKMLIQLANLFALLSLSQAATLYCTFSGNPSQCSVVNITNVAAPNETITVNGQPTNYVDNVTTTITFNQASTFDYFPSNIFTVFPNLQGIFLMNNSLPNLVSNALINCGNLQNFRASFLNFITLPAFVGPSCINLKALSFDSGKLTTLDVNAFQGMVKLEMLNMMNNKITCIPPGFFAGNPALSVLFFGNNQILALDPNTFSGLMYSHAILLEANQISYLPALNFGRNATSPAPLSFSVANNPINAINPNFLSNFYSSRNGSVGLSGTNCVPQTYGSISETNWVAENSSLSTCYSNWTPTMANTPVSCAQATTTTTTTSTTIAPTTTSSTTTACSLTTAATKTCTPLTTNGCNAFQIILNQFRNMTLSLNFF